MEQAPTTTSSTPAKRRGGKAPKRRGDTYEREVAAYLSIHTGLPVTRTPLSGGGASINNSGAADLTGATGLHVECKRTNRLNPRDALCQAHSSVSARRAPESPIVISRMDRETTPDSLAVMRLSDFLPFYNAWLTLHGYKKEPLK